MSQRIIPIKLRPGESPTTPDDSTAFTFKSLPPLALYVHFPWCIKKCPYCDFNSHASGTGPTNATGEQEKIYLEILNADLEAALPHIWGRRIVSIFIGGGTPSLLSVDAIDQLLTDLRQRLPIIPGAEVTLEGNPGAIDADKFRGFRHAGITRLSLGIQSFNSSQLQALERIHTGDEARRACALAVEYFPEVNFDLMLGLPGQSPAQALADIETALSFSPTHLSAYQLTIEPNTPFAARPPENLPDADAAADISEAVEARLAEAGFVHYETSAFARPGHECRHNLNYWQFGDYLGIGPGAHSKLTFPDRIVRQMRWKYPKTWLNWPAHISDSGPATPIQEENRLTTGAVPFEFMMNALRLNQGFAPTLFNERTGLPLARIMSILRRTVDDGLLEIGQARIRPTLRGRRYLNELLCRFLPE